MKVDQQNRQDIKLLLLKMFILACSELLSGRLLTKLNNLTQFYIIATGIQITMRWALLREAM